MKQKKKKKKESKEQWQMSACVVVGNGIKFKMIKKGKFSNPLLVQDQT